MRTELTACICILLTACLAASGCGYATRTPLPSNYSSIYIENFKNSIRVTEEQSSERMYTGYRPGMERDLTKAVIDKFLYDGSLKIQNAEFATLVLKGELIDFRREALRYDANENVEEYRIKLIVDLELEDVKAGRILWTEKGFAGEATYRTGGRLAKTENTAINDAIADLARRIVERTVEAW